MAVIMTSDYELQIEMGAIRTRFNVASDLKLFQNDITPDPNMLIATFTEATYSGYSSFDLSTEWAAPVEDADGKWSIAPASHDFTHSGGAVANTLFGIYVVDGVLGVYFAARFDTPFLFDLNSLPFRVSLKYTDKAEAVLP